MPCYDGRERESREEERTRLNTVTDMLCRMMKLCGPTFIAEFVPVDIQTWWEQHQKSDKLRT
jgi:hypothetical protein